MRSLFLRIFLSFWLAQALFIVLAIVATLALRPRGEPQLPPGLAAEAAAVYEQSGPITLIDFIHKLEDEERVHFFLFDEDAQEVTGRAGLEEAGVTGNHWEFIHGCRAGASPSSGRWSSSAASTC